MYLIQFLVMTTYPVKRCLRCLKASRVTLKFEYRVLGRLETTATVLSESLYLWNGTKDRVV